MQKYFAEFFAGVGLVREGLAATGWECAWANDISSEKAACYQTNYGAEHFHLGDLWQWENNPGHIPDKCSLWTASFPCTDLSLAGVRKGLAGAESGALHAFLAILAAKVAQQLAPPLVMLENVGGFLSSHKGADVAHTVRTLNQLGYVVDIIEIDAADFVPQSRQRIFVFALKAALAEKMMQSPPGPQHTGRIRRVFADNPELNWGHFDLAMPPRHKATLADMIEPLPLDCAPWWDESRKTKLWEQMFERHQDALKRMQTQSGISFATVFRRMRDNISRAELRFDGVAGCLRTPRGGSSKQILIQAGNGRWDVRLLTPREYARLQGVRDSFQLPQNENQGYFAMADAVCVPVIEFLAQQIISPVVDQLCLVQSAATSPVETPVRSVSA
ncbi:MAG: hypothetical protein RL748_2828 [Pseudomonadota bacterium]